MSILSCLYTIRTARSSYRYNAPIWCYSVICRSAKLQCGSIDSFFTQVTTLSNANKRHEKQQQRKQAKQRKEAKEKEKERKKKQKEKEKKQKEKATKSTEEEEAQKSEKERQKQTKRELYKQQMRAEQAREEAQKRSMEDMGMEEEVCLGFFFFADSLCRTPLILTGNQNSLLQKEYVTRYASIVAKFHLVCQDW